MKIGSKISFSILIIAIILTGTSTSITYIMIKNILQEKIYAHLRTTAQSRAHHIETYLTDHKDKIKILANSILLKDTLKGIIHSRPDFTNDVEKIHTEFKKILKTEGHFYELFVLNQEGEIILSTDKDNIGVDKSTDAYFLGGKEGVYIKDAYYSETTNKDLFAISAPISDDETKEFLGVVVAMSSLDDLNKITTDKTALGRTGDIYLVNKYGFMITPSRFIEDTFLKQKVDTWNVKTALMHRRSPVRYSYEVVNIFPDYRGVKVLGTHEYISQTDWVLLAEIDKREVLLPLSRLKTIFVGIILLIPILAWLMGNFVSRRITKPIHKLYRGTEIIGQGNLDYKVGTQTKDEIGQLSRAFDKMTDKLQGTTTSLDNLNKEITERKYIEAELKKSRNTAEELSRVKSEFLANISHEIRTPMNAVIGMTDLALETELTSEQSEFLRVIKSSSESLLSLINDLLDISKIEAGKLEIEEIPFNLREVVEGVAETLSIRAKDKGIEFLSYVDPGIQFLVIGDPTHLRQVLVNLVGNAIKFTEIGEVAIKVEIDSAKEETATGKRVGINFMVSDTGAGMSKADMEKIFDKFSQADSSTTRKYGGTGLGLSISKSIVEMMGGHISVESEAGKGSIFHFSLNLKYQEERREEEREYVCLDFKGITVLIVDDNRTSRYILQKTLSAWGFHTSEARNGKEALSFLQDNPDRFKIIILDYQMPDMDGMEVARTVREDIRFQDIKIIILTSWGSVKTSLMKELNIAGAILKPVKQSTLFNTLVKTFRTSIAVGERQVEGVVDSKAVQKTGDSIKALLVEDNIDNQNLVRTIMGKAGFAVDIANNGQEAVEAFRRFRYDLILMDIQMPVMDGFIATAHIREIEKELGEGRVPIIALTAHAMKGYRKKCLEHDMDDYITKPLKRNVFLKTIDKWVDARPAILVVDDIDINRKLIENYLKKEGAYRAVFAKNGKEAVDVFKRQAVSLILMDMEMPVMDGFTAAGAIRELDRGREIPIIAMTAHEEAGEINKCIEAGCTDYLCKPIRKQTFIETIRRYLGRSKDLSRDTVTSDKPAEETGQKDTAGENIVVYVDPDLKDLIPEFFENINKDIEEIRRLLAEGRIEGVQRICHSMKGSGSSYGFDEISEIGKGIEEAARDNNREEISCLNDRLAEYLSAVKVVLKEEG